ncbi:Rpp14/Pop5 family-domain-containing protein [Russula ochroleuca]|uniref:Rpp14/Pop5 family-domain-containing protein n=1 Tax=Russula ochroleuca TaxID=152965 RepID=A0A9P5JXB0_9AGAM|nr:Rpp14/Pop5 family-domain-containing protein [Russula ochroleuca]
MVRFKVRPILSFTLPLSAIEHLLRPSRIAGSLSSSLPAIATPGHDHTRATTTRSPPDAISGKDVFNALKQSVLLHFGDVGWGEVGASLAVKYFSPVTNLCVVRVARGTPTSITGVALVLLDRVVRGGGGVEGHKVVPHVIHVSGTLKNAQIAAIEWNRQAIARMKAGTDKCCTFGLPSPSPDSSLGAILTSFAASCRCRTPSWERSCCTVRNEHTGDRGTTGLTE